MRTAVSFGVSFALCLVAATNARADPLVITSTTITTSGVFRCLSFWGRKIPCSGEGTNSITFGSGDNTATLTFSGVTSMFEITNRATPATLGEFALNATDGFTFPTHPTNSTFPVVQFALNISQITPIPASDATGLWAVGGRTRLRFYGTPNNTLHLPLGANPYRYTAIIYTIAPHPVVVNPGGRTSLTANVGAVPEPATIVLLGTGLLALAGARHRRRFKNLQGCDVGAVK